MGAAISDKMLTGESCLFVTKSKYDREILLVYWVLMFRLSRPIWLTWVLFFAEIFTASYNWNDFSLFCLCDCISHNLLLLIEQPYLESFFHVLSF